MSGAPGGGLLRGFRGPRFRLVFVGRQQAAELAGGSRQRHGVPREESCRRHALPFASCDASRVQFARSGAHGVRIAGSPRFRSSP
ncbi:hypothetical protein [Burkholderia pseudomallei]